MASSSCLSTKQYPYPSDLKVSEFVRVKLSRTNYVEWRDQMLPFIKREGMVDFIGIPEEQEDDSCCINSANEKGQNQDYRSWKRSDHLLLQWLWEMINVEVHAYLVEDRLKAARDMWTMLGMGLSQTGSKKTSSPAKKKSNTGSTKASSKAKKESNTAAPKNTYRAGHNLSQYLPLYKAAIEGNCMKVDIILKKDPNAVRAIITEASETVLMVAVRSKRRNHLVKKLVDLMKQEDLELDDCSGQTALHKAAAVANLEAAKLLVNKNPDLPNVCDNSDLLPLHNVVASSGNREMVLYLLTVTKVEKTPKPCENNQGGKLMFRLIASEHYDIALKLLEKYPHLACVFPSPLKSIAAKPSAFRSGEHFNLVQNFIYSYVPLKVESFTSYTNGGDIESPTDCVLSEVESFTKHGNGGVSESPADCVIPVRKKLQTILWELAENFVPQITRIRKRKLKHHHAIELVKHLCMEVAKLDSRQAFSILEAPLMCATRIGIHEVVEEILWSFPDAVNLRNEWGQSVFHLAIVYRRENVLNLLHQFGEGKQLLLADQGETGYTSLHLAGKMIDKQRLSLREDAAGTALQMQLEVQWYKEVEKLSLPEDKEKKNPLRKHMTPEDLFVESHKELIKEGEEWMKGTANSCTIVAALIVTIVFAAAITIPGGNYGDNGFPIFSKEKAFVIFAISDALALFSSTSSLLTFLSILTSRYAENDFLSILPNRLIFGLITLFISIISMMLAFGATLYLVFGNEKTWIIYPVVALASLPVTQYAFLQFPLILDSIKPTYGRGIFRKQNNRVLY